MISSGKIGAATLLIGLSLGLAACGAKEAPANDAANMATGDNGMTGMTDDSAAMMGDNAAMAGNDGAMAPDAMSSGSGGGMAGDNAMGGANAMGGGTAKSKGTATPDGSMSGTAGASMSNGAASTTTKTDPAASRAGN